MSKRYSVMGIAFHVSGGIADNGARSNAPLAAISATRARLNGKRGRFDRTRLKFHCMAAGIASHTPLAVQFTRAIFRIRACEILGDSLRHHGVLPFVVFSLYKRQNMQIG
jgi:hypothetical protein